MKITRPFPPIGSPSLSNGIDRLERHVPNAQSVEREPADRGIASGKETLARRQLPQRLVKPDAMPRRAFPARTRRFGLGSVRNACTVKNDLTNPTSEPIASAAS